MNTEVDPNLDPRVKAYIERYVQVCLDVILPNLAFLW